MDNDQVLRNHLVKLLGEGSAHATFDQIIADWPENLRARKPDGLPYNAWQLLEHLRIAQWDILEFSRNPNHVSPDFPDGYWPPADSPPGEDAWQSSIHAFLRELDEMKKLVLDPAVDLLVRIPHGTGQTVLREAMLVADHNSYHLGQLVVLRRLLGAWQEN